MHYLLAVCPGTAVYNGQMRKMRPNDIIAVADEAAEDMLRSHAFLTLSSSDIPKPQPEPKVQAGAKFKAGPEPIVSNEEHPPLDLPPNATIAEVIQHLDYLALLDPQPKASILAVGKAYPKNGSVKDRVDRILQQGKYEPKAKSKVDVKVKVAPEQKPEVKPQPKEPEA
jgi:hypothetical protein